MELTKVRCHFCGHEGEYGVEVIETDHRDSTGHDSTVCACKDIDTCRVRQWLLPIPWGRC